MNIPSLVAVLLLGFLLCSIDVTVTEIRNDLNRIIMHEEASFPVANNND